MIKEGLLFGLGLLPSALVVVYYHYSKQSKLLEQVTETIKYIFPIKKEKVELEKVELKEGLLGPDALKNFEKIFECGSNIDRFAEFKIVKN